MQHFARTRQAGAIILILCAQFASAAGSVPPGIQMALAEPVPELRLQLKPLNATELLAEDLLGIAAGQPPHYARPVKIKSIGVHASNPTLGEWIEIDAERWLWRLQVEAPGASTLDFGFSEYWLPHGAALYIYDQQQRLLRGPFTDQQNKDHGELWTPLVPGDRAIIELEVSTELKPYVRLTLSQVNFGFRFLNDAAAKSGSCNVDVICPDGDAWRDQIRAVAVYGVGTNSTFCTGQMLNNTQQDNDPLFLTAGHCNLTDSSALSMTVYWNFQSSSCRLPGSSESGTPLNLADFSDSQTGATLLARNVGAVGSIVTDTDFTLVRLDEVPDDDFDVFWSGWDVSGEAPAQATAIHHPNADAKRISRSNLPLTITGYLSETDGGETHWRVRQWATGTTEAGSSGSGLWDAAGRLIGQLSGGYAACGNDPDICISEGGAVGSCDWYGRLSSSWDAEGSSANRLSDWLDPIDGGAAFIDGVNTCDQADVTLSSNRNTARVGQLIRFSSSVSGGAPPYRYAWDLDGDGATDSTKANVSGSFPDAINANISLRVIDSVNCATTTQLGQVVQGPRIEIDSVGPGVEQCGDGDNEVEPGESWSYPVTLINNGDRAASGVIAAFGLAAGGASSKRQGGPDSYGNSFIDSAEAGCAFDYQDISATGAQLDFTPSSDFPALDDGGAVVELGGPGFDLYGQILTQLTMSTNGYLSSSITDGGGDHSNDCPLPTAPEIGGGARMAVLHDDLVIEAGFHQYFNSCPRAGEADGSGGCNIFQWNGVSAFEDPPVDTEFQAILYDGSNQLVYQYLSGNDRAGASQSVGIQNAAASDALSYACNQADAVMADSAVCIFNNKKTRVGISLTTPAISLGNLGIGEQKTVEVNVVIDDSFGCGDLFGIDYLGSGHADGFSNQGTADFVSVAVGGAQSCDSTAMCSIDAGASIQPLDGFYYNPARQGNGIDLHFFSDQMFSAWFTAEAGRVPVWYQVLTQADQRVALSQIRANILRYSQSIEDSETSEFVTPEPRLVGEAVFSFVDAQTAVMTWMLNGETGGELIELLSLNATAATSLVSDQLFSPEESGWGVGYQQQDGVEFAAVYFYGVDGEPRWVLTMDPVGLFDQGDAPISAFEVNCPFCVWIEPTAMPTGDYSRVFNNDGTGLLSIDSVLSGEIAIDWQRVNLPVVRLNPANKGNDQ